MTFRFGRISFAIPFLALSHGGWADVTVQQKTLLDVATVIKMHGTSTTSVSADKRREDTESHCEGLMSLLCGNVQNGEIVRLDQSLTWRLQPDKKRYRQEIFATPEELAAMRVKMQANLQKMRSCPVSPLQEPIDRSKCEMSAPKIEVHKTDDRTSIAGHDAQRTAATLTETCTNKDTGDVCDTIVAVDLWLTQDALPGSADRRFFDAAYAKKLGIDDTAGILRGQVAKFLAPYQSQIKQLTDKSADMKGQPLKTSLRVLLGGQQCSTLIKLKAERASSQTSSGGSGDDGTSTMAQAAKAGLSQAAQAGKAVGNLVGGLFHKKKPNDASDTAAGAAPSGSSGSSGSNASSGSKVPDPYAQYSQLAAFTMETVMFNTDAVPAERFEIPPDWKRDMPKPVKGGDDDYVCPKT